MLNSLSFPQYQVSLSTNPSQLNTHELVILDAGVENIQQLIEGIKPGVDWVVLNANQDGIEQITRILANHPDIKTLHLVSHGAPGCLFLGNSQLSLDTLETYATQLQSWFAPPAPQVWEEQVSISSLPPSPQHWGSKDSQPAIVQTPLSLKVSIFQSPHSWGFGGRDLGAEDLGRKEPSILLYACNVAAGDAGEEFITKLHSLTGATIAASSTPVGSIVQGGNWNLDVTTAPLTVASAFQAETLAAYTGLLGGTPVPIGDEFLMFDDSLRELRNPELDPISLDPNNVDITTIRLVRTAPSVVSLDDGGFVVVSAFQDISDDNTYEGPYNVYGQRYDAYGNRVGDNFQVTTYADGDKINPSVATLNDGGFIVAWQSLQQNVFEGDGGAVNWDFIYDQETGELVSAKNSYGRGNIDFNYDINSGQIVATASSDYDNDDFFRSGERKTLIDVANHYGWDFQSEIYAQRYDSSGTKVGQEFIVSRFYDDDPSDYKYEWDAMYPSVTGLYDGSFGVIWQEVSKYPRSENFYENNIYMQKFEVQGDQISPVLNRWPMGNLDADRFGKTLIAPINDADGYFSVSASDSVWAASVTNLDIMVSGLNTNSVTSQTVNSQTLGTQEDPSMTILNDGGFVITWNQDSTSIYGQRFDADGNKVGIEFQINQHEYSNPKRVGDSSITAMSDGGFVVAWTYGSSGYQ